MEATDSQFEIKKNIDDEWVSLIASGDYSLIKAYHLFEFAIDNAIAEKKSKVLIEVTGVTGNISLTDRFQYSNFLSDYYEEHALGKVNKIAVVGSDLNVHSEKFGQIVARNRGANVCVFTDMDKAVNWLTEK